MKKLNKTLLLLFSLLVIIEAEFKDSYNNIKSKQIFIWRGGNKDGNSRFKVCRMLSCRGLLQEGAEMKKMALGIATPVDILPEVYKKLEEQYNIIYGEWYSKKDYQYTTEEMLERFGKVNGLICASRDKITREYMEKAKELFVVVKQGTGYDKIDVAAATDLGILVCNSPAENNSVSTAEGAIAHILAACKKYRMLDIRARAGQWKDVFGLPSMIYGKTIGIMGFGRIGQNVAQRLQGWGVTILVYDPYVPEELIKEKGGIPVSKEELFLRSDIISPHLILNDETHHIIDAEAFEMMKPTAVIVNVARGGIIDQKALVYALESGKIAGAGIDVFETEPLSADEPITKLQNVILTPHSVGLTRENMEQMVNMALEVCVTAISGIVPASAINKEVLPVWKKRMEALK